MRKKFILGEKKAVVTSVLAVLIICFASTAVPAMNGSKISNLIESQTIKKTNERNKYDFQNLFRMESGVEDISYKSVFSFLENKLGSEKCNFLLPMLDILDNYVKEKFGEDFLEDFSIFFRIVSDYFGSEELTKKEFKRIFNENIIPLKNEVKSIAKGEKELKDISPTLKDIFSNYNMHLKNQDVNGRINQDLISTDMGSSQHFGDYWYHYKEIQKNWHLLGEETMAEWEKQTRWVNGLLVFFDIVLLITSALYGILGGPLLPFILMTVVIAINLLYILYLVDGFGEWLWLVGLSTNLVLHVKDQNGEDIDNLENYIKAHNIEAYQKINEGEFPENHKSYFTYPLDSDTGFSGPGWYSTSSWWHQVDDANIWDKVPCPPGFWNISIEDVDGYENAYIDQTEDMLKHKTSVIELTLFSNPHIPHIVSEAEDISLYVGETGSYTVSAKDPDNGNVSYQLQWGDGTISEWTEFVNSGESVTVNNIWNKCGIYEIKARTKDDQSEISPWSNDFTVYVCD